MAFPQQITSDNGSQLKSLQFREFTEKLGLKHVFTSEYHPQSNGMDERFNGSLIKILRSYISDKQNECDHQLN